MPDPMCVSLAVTPDLRYLSMVSMSDLTNNKQRGQLCIIVVRREKRKKKRTQSITKDNLTIICLHVPHHVEESMNLHLMRQRMARFGHREASHAPL
jgi:hypothetical protein